jgi:hypothetical protein
MGPIATIGNNHKGHLQWSSLGPEAIQRHPPLWETHRPLPDRPGMRNVNGGGAATPVLSREAALSCPASA